MMPGVTSAFQPRAAGHRNGTPTTPKWDTHRRTPKRRNGTPTEDHRTGTPTELGHPPNWDTHPEQTARIKSCTNSRVAEVCIHGANATGSHPRPLGFRIKLGSRVGEETPWAAGSANSPPAQRKRTPIARPVTNQLRQFPNASIPLGKATCMMVRRRNFVRTVSHDSGSVNVDGGPRCSPPIAPDDRIVRAAAHSTCAR